MIITTLIYIAIASLAGIFAISAQQLFKEKVVLVLAGSILGLAATSTITYIVDIALPLTAATIWLSLVIAIAVAIGSTFLNGRQGIKPALDHIKSIPTDKAALIIAALLFILFASIAPKLLISQTDGLYTGVINAYGDVAWHLANITSFAEGQTTPPQNPILANTRLTYPFMTNFFSAIAIKLGATYSESVNLPAFLLIPGLLTFLYCFVRDFTKGSKKAGIIALLLFLFGGATLGWMRFGSDFQESGMAFWEFLTNLPARDYSGVGTDEQGFHFLNPVTTLLLPQRSFLFAFPIAFAILLLLTPRVAGKNTTAAHITAGVLAGLLPLFHAHSVLALIPAIIGMFIIDMIKAKKARGHIFQDWLLFVLVSMIIGIPEILYYIRGGQEAGSFLRWGPGWMSGEMNIILYWIQNTGLLIPVAVYGLFTKAPKKLKALAIAGLLIFLIANLYLFAPWAWDNFKLFVYFFIFILPIVGWVAAQYFKKETRIGIKIAVVVVIFLHTFSAGLDIWKLSLPTAAKWNEWNAQEIAFAKQVVEVTEPGESILTYPSHNSLVVLAGRPRYLGFSAHVWSHGGDPWVRENVIEDFYQGKTDTLPESDPDYVLVSPQETFNYSDISIRPDWELVAQSNGYQLYKR